MLPTRKTPAKHDLADFSVLIYGPSKIGKTSFCARAEDALFLATEPGLNALEVFQVPITSWRDLLEACAELTRVEHSFRTVVVDTIDNAFRMCAEHVCSKHGVEHEADLPYGKGFSLVSNEFQRVLRKLAFLPVGLYLISHAQEREVETRTGRHTRIVPNLPEKARRIVVGLVDLVLYCDFDGNGRRVIRTKPTAAYDAGDRTGRLPPAVDLDYEQFVAAFRNGTTEKAASAAARQDPEAKGRGT
jgi:hypothetical protein